MRVIQTQTLQAWFRKHKQQTTVCAAGWVTLWQHKRLLLQPSPAHSHRWSHIPVSLNTLWNQKTDIYIVTYSDTFSLTQCCRELQTACGAHIKRRSDLPISWWERRHGEVNGKTPGGRRRASSYRCPYCSYTTQIKFDIYGFVKANNESNIDFF